MICECQKYPNKSQELTTRSESQSEIHCSVFTTSHPEISVTNTQKSTNAKLPHIDVVSGFAQCAALTLDVEPEPPPNAPQIDHHSLLLYMSQLGGHKYDLRYFVLRLNELMSTRNCQ